jgi:RHS repeat-associated protein
MRRHQPDKTDNADERDGNRRSKSLGGSTTAYLYDLAHQLSEVRSGSDTGTLTGAAVHDADGHMTKLCEVSSGGTVTKTTNDCTASGTGATTLALVWNALDHLLTATRTGANAVAESYQYDDQSRRITKVGAGGTAHYLYNGDDIHAEWANAMVGMPQAVYAHGAGTDEPLLRLTGSTNSPSATQAAYLQDGLGSVVGTTNITGTLTASQRFDAWGNKITSSGTIPQYGYTGREPDQTGLMFYRARYYHAGIGRFMSRDPAGMADAVSPYAYVQNNPVNLIDPMGLLAQLTGTPMNPAYWGMLADSSSAGSTRTDVSATPGNQSLRGNSQDSSLASSFALAGTIAVAEPTPFGEIVLGAAVIGVGAYTLADKMATEIKGIAERKDLGPQGEVYSLRATRSGEYPNVRGGTTTLNAGDVYKYGETTQPDARYSETALRASGLRKVTEFEGTQMISKIVEKQRIYGHFFEYGELPPGNRIFR